MRRSIRLMLLVALALIAMLASAASAKAADQICGRYAVSFNNIERGYLAGCFFSKFDESGWRPFVDGAFDVCDYVDEPQETNIVRAQVMVAFSDGVAWSYANSPWYPAQGDGAGCFSFLYYQAGPEGVVWEAKYVKITVEAPGKAVAVYRPGF
jgi:hypothetical protein